MTFNYVKLVRNLDFMSSREVFIDNLKRLRKAKVGSQQAMADALGITLRAYQRYEYAQTSPSPEMLDQFARILNCEPYVFFLEPETAPETSDLHEAIKVLKALDAAPVFLRKVCLYLLTGNPSDLSDLAPQARKMLMESRKTLGITQKVVGE